MLENFCLIAKQYFEQFCDLCTIAAIKNQYSNGFLKNLYQNTCIFHIQNHDKPENLVQRQGWDWQYSNSME